MTRFQRLMKYGHTKPKDMTLAEWKGCKLKTPHATLEKAQKEAERMNRESFGLHDVFPYKCRFCGKYHNGGNNR